MPKNINTRIQNKHDIEANWLNAINFIPLAGEIIIYDPDENHDLPRVKIGDGKTLVNQLEFIDANLANAISEKADAEHGTHVIFGEADPVMAGVAFAGSASTVARSDHKHPTDTSRASQADLTAHISDTDSHITSADRDNLEVAYEHSQTAHNYDISGSAANAQQAAEAHADSVLAAHNTDTEAHNDVRLLITSLSTRLNALADSDDTTLDQMSEVVAYIKSNKSLIEEVTTNKVNVSDIINDLTTNVSNKPLSAAQGVALKALIDAIVVPTKVSELTNDTGYLTAVPAEYVTETELSAKGYLTEHQSLDGYAKTADLGTLASKNTVAKTDLASGVQASLNKADTALQSYTETDPTVPAWAKEPTKPVYTAEEVGALSADTLIPGALVDLASDPDHRVVTDEEKAFWNAKSDFSGSYNDLTDKPSIPSSTGTASTSGLTKLYTNTGTNTDGAMTQKAITEALDSLISCGTADPDTNISSKFYFKYVAE